jgi:hypothetical protein
MLPTVSAVNVANENPLPRVSSVSAVTSRGPESQPGVVGRAAPRSNGLVRRVLARLESGQEPLGRGDEWRKVVLDRGLDDRVSGVEVSVGEVVAHPGDVAPGDPGSVASRSGSMSFTASPISMRRTRTASNTSPSSKPPRSRCDAIASAEATMSANRSSSRRVTAGWPRRGPRHGSAP